MSHVHSQHVSRKHMLLKSHGNLPCDCHCNENIVLLISAEGSEVTDGGSVFGSG